MIYLSVFFAGSFFNLFLLITKKKFSFSLEFLVLWQGTYKLLSCSYLFVITCLSQRDVYYSVFRIRIRVRIRLSEVRIRGSGSVTKCH
jgi:hypothetical protein